MATRRTASSTFLQKLLALPGAASVAGVAALALIGSAVTVAVLKRDLPDLTAAESAAFIRITPKDAGKFSVRLEQTVLSAPSGELEERLDISLVKLGDLEAAPIRHLDIGASQLAVESGWGCVWTSEYTAFQNEGLSPTKGDVDKRAQLISEYREARQALIGASGLKDIAATRHFSAPQQAENTEYVNCSGPVRLERLGDATNEVAPTKVVIELAGKKRDLFEVRPRYTMTTPVDWTRTGIVKPVEDVGNDKMSSISYPGVPYISSPLESHYTFHDPARQTFIDGALNAALLFAGALFASMLEMVRSVFEKKRPRVLLSRADKMRRFRRRRVSKARIRR